MAYYDQFTKKPRSPRDDWRDDEETLRPERDGEQNRRPYGGRPNNGERRAYGERPNNGERRAYGERSNNGERRGYGERPNNGERRPYGERPNNGERRPYGERPNNGERRPYGERPNNGERRPYGERPMTPPAPQEEEMCNLLVGRNPIREALKAGRDMEKLLVAKGELIGSAREIVAMAREQKVIVQEVDRAHLDAMAPGHQGLIAVVSAYAYQTVDDMLALAKARGEAPFLVILDGVTDPHNLGAIIRTAECAGAHGVVIPKRRSAGLTSIVAKTSAGAVSYVPVARVPNIPALLEQLQKEGVWVFGTAAEGTSDLYSADLKGPAAIVIGSEGDGMTRLVREKCDFLVSIPMKGKISSLNASAAAAILLYEAVRQRLGK